MELTPATVGAMISAGPPTLSAQPFDDVTAIAPVDEGRFTGEVSAEWTIGGKPNGGYLLAMMGRAAAVVTAHDHVIAASAHYLHSPDPGPVGIQVEVLRTGRTASQARARLRQDERPCVEALVTTSRLERGVDPYWDGGVPARSQVAYDEAVPLPARLPNGNRVAILEQIGVRLDPDSRGFTSGVPSGRGELRGWLELPGGAPFDPVALLFAVDALPPATFDIAFAGWVPTLELTAYVRALPEPGPVRILQRAQLISAERVDEACFVWDRAGRLVAHGTQLAGIRLG
jgi:acyl-coenzyme A thioesterase PaaI-like protein